MLVGVSGHLLDRLQSVLNAAARLVFSERRSERITPLLRDLHWLRVPERIRIRSWDIVVTGRTDGRTVERVNGTA